MSSNTTNINLLKMSPTTDGNLTFNIDTMLNANWDKIDVYAKAIVDALATHKTSGDHDTKYYTQAVLNAITAGAAGADKIGATAISGYTGATVQAILAAIGAALVTHKTSADHDSRYYTETEIGATTSGAAGADKVGATAVSGYTGATVQAILAAIGAALITHKASADHDSRYYTETEIGSTTSGSSGADKVGASSIAGLTGNTVQALLLALKNYVDSVQQGIDTKNSVKITSSDLDTALLSSTYNNGVLTFPYNGAIDLYEATEGGVTLSVGDRILVKDMYPQSANGIYTITSLGSSTTPAVLTRATDADTAAKLSPGSYFFVEAGKKNSDSGWVMTADSPITLGTTAITWSQFSGAGQIIAGVGLQKDGNTLGIPQGAVTDALIGNRTIVDTAAANGYTGTLQVFLNAFAYMLKSITGKTHYYDAPATTLEAANTHINAAAPHSGHAPSGYGLGGGATRLTTGYDLNSLVANGWYDVQSPVNGVPGFPSTWHSILVINSADSGANYVTQLAFPMGGTTVRFYERQKIAGTWYSWQEGLTSAIVGTGKAYDYLNRIYSNGFADTAVSTAGNALRHYHDLAAYSTVSPTVTGLLKITLPRSWSSTMFSIKIKGYDYTMQSNAWELTIGGYNYAATSTYSMYGASMTSGAPFTSVRLAHDGTRCCILLGVPTTTWLYPKVVISEVITGYSQVDGWDTGWGFNFLTSETGLTSVVTCPINTGFRAADITVDGDILATANSTYGQKQLAPSGTWARGSYYFNAAGNTTLGGYGMHGSSDTMDFFYLGFNNQPWNSPAFKVEPSGYATAVKFISSVLTGTAPLSVVSKTRVDNLNVDQVDGYDATNAATANTIPVRDASGNIAGVANSNGSSIYNLSSSGSSYNGYWVPITDVVVNGQYNHAEVRFELFGGATGTGGVFPRATVEARIKQQNPLGQNPIIDLHVSNCTVLSVANFKAVTTVTGSTSTVTIYVQFLYAYENYYVCPIFNYGSNAFWTFYNSQAPMSAPPAGTFQTAATNKYAQQLTTNGYKVHDGGLIEQWGYATISGTAYSTVTFPITFPTAVLNVVCTPIDINAQSVSVYGSGTTTNSFQAKQSWSGGTLPVYWRAIGN